MKILSRVIDRVKSVYQYEKTTRIDAGAIQNVMIIFVIVMLLINIQNFRLGEYFVTALTLVVSGISIFAILALGYSDKIYVICMASVVIFLILSIPISLLGPNRGFALLWYFLMPIVSIVLLGMPFGIPVSGSFGIYITVMFYTPLKGLLIYDYPKYYLFYYPIFYWSFCIIVVVIDIFYKRYQMNQEENERSLERDVTEALSERKKLMIDAVTAISQMLDEKDGYTQQHSKRVAEYSMIIAKIWTGSSQRMSLVSYIGVLCYTI